MSLQYIKQSDINNHKSTGFISIYKPIAGWKAICYWWNPDMDGFWEPWDTSEFPYATPQDAYEDAKHWADCDDIPILEYSEINTGE